LVNVLTKDAQQEAMSPEQLQEKHGQATSRTAASVVVSDPRKASQKQAHRSSEEGLPNSTDARGNTRETFVAEESSWTKARNILATFAFENLRKAVDQSVGIGTTKACPYKARVLERDGTV
jgi:hypothetical protein